MTASTDVLASTGDEMTPIVEKVRRGRLAALAALRAKTAANGKVVSIFETQIQTRDPYPVFHSVRAPHMADLPPLLLTNPIAA